MLNCGLPLHTKKSSSHSFFRDCTFPPSEPFATCYLGHHCAEQRRVCNAGYDPIVGRLTKHVLAQVSYFKKRLMFCVAGLDRGFAANAAAVTDTEAAIYSLVGAAGGAPTLSYSTSAGLGPTALIQHVALYHTGLFAACRTFVAMTPFVAGVDYMKVPSYVWYLYPPS